MKKLIALVLALALVLMVGAVYAEGADSAGLTTSTWRGSLDGSISVSGLTQNDSVKFYKILAYDQNAVKLVADATSVTEGAGSWKAVAPFDTMTLDDFKYILTTGISVEIAGRLANMATGTVSPVTVGSNGVASVSNPDPGLYIALVTPADPEVVYNPVFVGADYYTNDSGVWAVAATTSYNPAAMAKKETITLEKDITDQTGDTRFDRAVGDTVGFTITSKVPAFSDAYDSPVYELTDTMSSGLELQALPTVSIANVTLADGDYTITPSTFAAGITTFKITVNATGLAKVAATGLPQVITVTYNAKITSIDDYNVNEKDNTATVKFSNNPGNDNSYSLLEDRTRNYTFSIDANLLGHTGWENSELVKIGMDAAGNEITKKTLSNGTEAGVLADAEFGLYTNEACTTLYTNTNVTPNVNGHYISDANGKLHIKGLDAGTYYLKEIQAPTGYVKDQATYKIEITASYTDVEAGSYTNGDNILVKYGAYRILDGYTVKVTNLTTNDVVSSNFTVTNAGTYNKTATTISEADATTKLKNIRGTELPSTGGIGTTLFYVIGGLLVIGAAVVLVARRKAHE